MVNFDDWCYHAVAQIRFKPDRQMVFEELKAHLEDSYDHFLSQGYPAERAQRLAMEAMGDPEEIAPQLGAIHKPWLGYIYRFVKWITIPACIWAVFLLDFMSWQPCPAWVRPHWWFRCVQAWHSRVRTSCSSHWK